MDRQPFWGIRQIVSGGQTGVDRGALDAAITLGIPHGGWCPRGRRAENGPIPCEYRLQETESSHYHVRTRLNVQDSDGTLVLYKGTLHGGTELTVRLAEQYCKPCLCIDLAQQVDLDAIRNWAEKHGVGVLNVAGPRLSSTPGIDRECCDLLSCLLRDTR